MTPLESIRPLSTQQVRKPDYVMKQGHKNRTKQVWFSYGQSSHEQAPLWLHPGHSRIWIRPHGTTADISSWFVVSIPTRIRTRSCLGLSSGTMARWSQSTKCSIHDLYAIPALISSTPRNAQSHSIRPNRLIIKLVLDSGYVPLSNGVCNAPRLRAKNHRLGTSHVRPQWLQLTLALS